MEIISRAKNTEKSPKDAICNVALRNHAATSAASRKLDAIPGITNTLVTFPACLCTHIKLCDPPFRVRFNL